MSGENRKILICALDGLDKELIDKFDCNILKQEYYGNISYHDDLKIKTSELFACFITGKLPDSHGISGLWSGKKNPISKRLEDTDLGKFLLENVRGFHLFNEVLNEIFSERWIPTKADLETDSIFENVDNSRAMFIPAYNPSTFWRLRNWVKSQKFLKPAETLDYWKEREFRFRKRKLLSEIRNDIISPRNLLMVHFQYPDLVQHVYGDKDTQYNEDKLKGLYDQMDDFANKIVDEAKETGYDTIILMSDHGLPNQDGEHLKNGFYSVNRDIGIQNAPVITDFADIIKENIE